MSFTFRTCRTSCSEAFQPIAASTALVFPASRQCFSGFILIYAVQCWGVERCKCRMKLLLDLSLSYKQLRTSATCLRVLWAASLFSNGRPFQNVTFGRLHRICPSWLPSSTFLKVAAGWVASNERPQSRDHCWVFSHHDTGRFGVAFWHILTPLLQICLRETETSLSLSWAIKLGTLTLGTTKKAKLKRTCSINKHLNRQLLRKNSKPCEQVSKALIIRMIRKFKRTSCKTEKPW